MSLGIRVQLKTNLHALSDAANTDVEHRRRNVKFVFQADISYITKLEFPSPNKTVRVER